MRKSKQPTVLTDIQVTAELTKLRENPRVSPSYICKFLSDVFAYNAKLTGRKMFPRLLPFNLRSQELKIIDDKPCLVAEVSWLYVYPQRIKPNIEGADAVLTGLTIKIDASTNDNKKLGVELVLDLNEWPHVARNLLHSYLIVQKEGHTTNSDINLLVDHFYPTTNRKVLQLSRDLGMVPRDKSAFKSWLEELCKKPFEEALDLPVALDFT